LNELPQPFLLNIKNPSNKDLFQDTISAFAKGPNFAVAPRKILNEDYQPIDRINRFSSEQTDNI